MDDLAREILETIEAFKKQGQKKHDSRTGVLCSNVLFENTVLKFSYEVKIPDPEFEQPPVLFEKKYGFQGISRQYCLPKGLSCADLQIYALLLQRRIDTTQEQRLGKMTEVWDALITRNLSLERLRGNPEDSDTLFHIIMGVASAFNVNDIQHYIVSGESAHREMEESSLFKKLCTVFNNENPDLRWVASPETLQMIYDCRRGNHLGPRLPRSPKPSSF